MKIKVLSRPQTNINKQINSKKVERNLDPTIHPFQKAREYVRALNATKLDRLFAKPFIGALSGHCDTIQRMTTVPFKLSALISGSCDGELRIQSLPTKSLLFRTDAHSGFVNGISLDRKNRNIVTCGVDKQIKLQSLDQCSTILMDDKNDYSSFNLIDNQKKQARIQQVTTFYNRDIATNENQEFNENYKITNNNNIRPIETQTGKFGFLDVDCQYDSDCFATAVGQNVSLQDFNRSEPIHSFSQGIDTVNIVKFNRVETNLLCAASNDCTTIFYDIRQRTPLKKLVMRMSTNLMCQNPMEAFNFTLASDDTNLYSFDMRKLDHATNVHKDHVQAVMSVDYSPTGREFVSGSYDRTIRIQKTGQGHSREVYHTKRMQRVFCVKYSIDSTFVISGSDDTNIRIQKSKASERLGTLLPREKEKARYNEKLKQKFRYMPEIRRIQRHRHVPRSIYKAGQLRHTMNASARRKEERRRKHSKPGSTKFVAERSRNIMDVKN